MSPQAEAVRAQMDDFVKTSIILGELFGWSPVKLNDASQVVMQEICKRTVEGIQNVYERINRTVGNAYDAELKSGVDQLSTQFQKVVTSMYDRVDAYSMKNIFTLPQSLVESGFVRLPGTEDVNFGVSKDINEDLKTAEKDLIEEIQKIQRLTALSERIDEEMKILDALEPVIPEAQLSNLGAFAATAASVASSSRRLNRAGPLKRKIQCLDPVL